VVGGGIVVAKQQEGEEYKKDMKVIFGAPFFERSQF